MIANEANETRKRIVIVGAGYGGATLAKFLDTTENQVCITLISSREGFFLHKVSTLRSLVLGKAWIDRSLIPLSQLMHKPYNRFLQGTVVAVKPDNKFVLLQDGSAVSYDVLVICSGSQSKSPGEPPIHLVSLQETKAYYADLSGQVQKSQHIVVLGSGPTALELCGEIRQEYSDKSISCVTMANQLLGPSFPQAFTRALEKDLLETLHVGLFVNDSPMENMSESWYVPMNHTLMLKSGKTLPCDLVLCCCGYTLNTQFLPATWLDPGSGEVICDEYGAVKTTGNTVFCLGDAAKSNYAKLAYMASENAPVIGKNVLSAISGQDPSFKTLPHQNVMLIPLGSDSGRANMFGFVVGKYMTSLLKGRSLFTFKYWITLGNSFDDYPAVENEPSNWALSFWKLGLRVGKWVSSFKVW